MERLPGGGAALNALEVEQIHKLLERAWCELWRPTPDDGQEWTPMPGVWPGPGEPSRISWQPGVHTRVAIRVGLLKDEFARLMLGTPPPLTAEAAGVRILGRPTPYWWDSLSPLCYDRPPQPSSEEEAA